jgi:hypothetical protein
MNAETTAPLVTTNTNIEIVESTTNLNIVEDQETYEVALANTAYDQIVPFGLYMVTMTYKRKDSRMRANTHIAYVMAPDEATAISQVSQIPMDTEDCAISGSLALQSGEMTASAVRIPMHIRGWGLTTF